MAVRRKVPHRDQSVLYGTGAIGDPSSSQGGNGLQARGPSISDEHHRYLGEIDTDIATVETALSSIQAATGDASNSLSGLLTVVMSWLIEYPEDKDYQVIINMPYEVTINSVTTKTSTGTATVTGKINTTALGGTANSASTSEQTQSHTTANVLAAGDDFKLTVSSSSAPEDLTITVKATRSAT